MVVNGRDATGALRPKRVEVTTEFREFWACVAMHDPDKVRAMAAERARLRAVVGGPLRRRRPARAERRGARDRLRPRRAPGHGNDRRLRVAGVPAQPTGRLNMERALFMTHPINGIDDLIYVAIFGAHAVLRRASATCAARPPATTSSARSTSRTSPATTPTRRSRSASTTSSTDGAQVALDNPLGMYIRRPNLERLLLRRRAAARGLGALQPRQARAPTSAWSSARPTSTRRSSTTSRSRSARPSSR